MIDEWMLRSKTVWCELMSETLINKFLYLYLYLYWLIKAPCDCKYDFKRVLRKRYFLLLLYKTIVWGVIKSEGLEGRHRLMVCARSVLVPCRWPYRGGSLQRADSSAASHWYPPLPSGQQHTLSLSDSNGSSSWLQHLGIGPWTHRRGLLTKFPLLFLVTGSESGRGGEPGSEESDPAGWGGSEAGTGDGDGLRGGDPPVGGGDCRAEDPEGGAASGDE